MPGGYRHTTDDERCHIHALKASGISNRKIEEDLDRYRSTVDREIARNGESQAYCQKQARNKAAKLRSAALPKPRKMRAFL